MTHPLKDWLARQTPPLKVKEFAERLGVHPIKLRRLFNAENSVSRKIFEDIEAATEGELTAVDLYVHYRRQRADQHEGAAS
jgi:DNA-binding transcriptional regulator YdaS (Cro superfamily)